MRLVLRLLLIAVLLTPLAFMVAGSLRRIDLPPPPGFDPLPDDPGFSAYGRVADVVPLGRLFLNSAVVVLIAVPLTVIIATWAGFALAQLPRRSRRLLVAVTVGTLMIPLPMLWVARFVIYRKLGVLDTPVPLVAPALAATTPFTVLLAYRAFSRLPPELFEAARLEGASALATWWRVGLPLIRSTATAVAAIAFVFHWGNFLDALLYVQSQDQRTLPLGLGELADLDSNETSVLLAGAVILAVPALLALLAVQRQLLHASQVVEDR